jgi:poly(ADP-ribose) glycohydrolase ARH3
MSVDLAKSLTAKGMLDPDDLAKRFAGSYHWSRGYGPGAAKCLKRIRRGTPWEEASRSVYREGSFGNGAAMRAPIVALFYARNAEELLEAVRLSARITHAHPLGVEGAVLIATAVSAALRSSDPERIYELAARQCGEPTFRDRLAVAQEWLFGREAPGPKDVAKQLGHGVAAAESCVTALYLGLRFLPGSFAELQRFVAKCGGDADTIGAMSGAIWGAANGAKALPRELLQGLEQREMLTELADSLHAASLEISSRAPTALEGAVRLYLRAGDEADGAEPV